jgi:hypothetical protein
MWFDIKNEPSCTNGARLLWKMTHLTNYLPTKLKVVVQEVIQRNAFYAHPENILVSMLMDEERSIWHLALKRIIAAKKINEESRKFTVPRINFKSDSYANLNIWKKESIKEPPRRLLCISKMKIF